MKWGYKAVVLCDAKEVTYNLIICSCAIDRVRGLPDCGARGNIVLNFLSVDEHLQNVYHATWTTGCSMITILLRFNFK